MSVVLHEEYESSASLKIWHPASPRLAFAAALLLTFFIGFIDYRIGDEMSFAVLYILPVAVVSWWSGLTPGLFISAVSSTVWLVSDEETSRPFSGTFLPYWEMGMRMMMYVALSVTLFRLRQALHRESVLARTDPLTGLPNRRAFYEALEREAHWSLRQGRPLTLAYVDVDRFKQINDQYGHEAGDEVLCAIADSVSEHIRRTDSSARLGGDEFGIILPETEPSAAKVTLEKLREVMLDAMRRRKWPVTFSIGVVTFERPPVSPSEIIRRADSLMYRVKEGGRDGMMVENVPA